MDNLPARSLVAIMHFATFGQETSGRHRIAKPVFACECLAGMENAMRVTLAPLRLPNSN